MTKQVCNGAVLQCSFGAAPSQLAVTPEERVSAEQNPAATVMDHMPAKNIQSFDICSSPTNPDVVKATAAAQGVFTPQPCIPVTSEPWKPGSSTVKVGSIRALTSTCTLLCKWQGVITVQQSGQISVNTGM